MYRSAVEPNGYEKPPIWYMREPQRGPNKNPTPVAISISPMFYSRSLAFDDEITIAMEATALMPEPNPPII